MALLRLENRALSFTLPSSTWTTVLFNTVVSNTYTNNAYVDIGTPNYTEITFVRQGAFLVTAGTSLDATSGNFVRGVAIHYLKSPFTTWTVLAAHTLQGLSSDLSSLKQYNVATIHRFYPNDKIRVQIFQATGASATISGGMAPAGLRSYPYISLAKVG